MAAGAVLFSTVVHLLAKETEVTDEVEGGRRRRKGLPLYWLRKGSFVVATLMGFSVLLIIRVLGEQCSLRISWTGERWVKWTMQ